MNHKTPQTGQFRPRDPAKEQSWREALEQFAASGQSVREFCAARRLKGTAFYFWRREIQRRGGPLQVRRVPVRHARRRPRSSPTSVAFAKVLVQRPVPGLAEPSLCLRLLSGRELLLPVSLPAERLAALVRAIEDAT